MSRTQEKNLVVSTWRLKRIARMKFLDKSTLVWARSEKYFTHWAIDDFYLFYDMDFGDSLTLI
jgi:hypothetical protein